MNRILLVALLALFSCKKEEKASLVKKVITKDTLQKTTEKIEEVRDFPEAYAFLKKLIKEDIDGQEYENLQTKKMPFSVHYPNDDDQYTVSFSVVEKCDLNNDGIMDYVVNRSSEGMLGGNVNTNQQYTFYIMKDDVNEKEAHILYAYAPFSYNVIDEFNYKNTKFTAAISQNYRVYNVDDIQSAKMSFVYKNNNLYEESYLTDCKLAQLQSKTIFKVIPNVIRRNRTIEGHNYTESITEAYEKNDTLVTAELSGCDNLLLTFETSYKVTEEKMTDDSFKKNTALKFLDFLSRNTQFSKEIMVARNYFKTNPIAEDYIAKVKGYKFRVLVDQNADDENQMRFLVNIEKINNPKQMENWEIATRKK